MELFTLPYEKILNNVDYVSRCDSFIYSNANIKIELYQKYLHLSVDVAIIDGDDKNYVKRWEIHAITKSSLKALNKRINAYLEKIGEKDKFYDVLELTDLHHFYDELKKRNKLTGEFEATLRLGRAPRSFTLRLEEMKHPEYVLYEGKIIYFMSLTLTSLVELCKYMEGILNDEKESF